MPLALGSRLLAKGQKPTAKSFSGDFRASSSTSMYCMPVVSLTLSTYPSMKALPRIRSQLVLLALLTSMLAVSVAAQSSPQLLASTDAPVVVHSVRVLPGPAGPVVEILSNHPLVPPLPGWTIRRDWLLICPTRICRKQWCLKATSRSISPVRRSVESASTNIRTSHRSRV